MSQHIINSKSPTQTVTVGYDRPLNEFFANVLENGEVIEWISSAKTVEDLAAQIEPYADLSTSLRNELKAEKSDRHNHPMMKHVDHRSA